MSLTSCRYYLPIGLPLSRRLVGSPASPTLTWPDPNAWTVSRQPSLSTDSAAAPDLGSARKAKLQPIRLCATLAAHGQQVLRPGRTAVRQSPRSVRCDCAALRPDQRPAKFRPAPLVEAAVDSTGQRSTRRTRARPLLRHWRPRVRAGPPGRASHRAGFQRANAGGGPGQIQGATPGGERIEPAAAGNPQPSVPAWRRV